MKVQCDVCGQQAAAVFCCADEAALCDACDSHVHTANKLAGKHHRFSLLNPSLPLLCDICKEKRAFLFCQEDRAVLCRDCDASIHAVNEHTKKHSRFLLTGIKLSAEPLLASEAGSDTKLVKAKSPEPTWGTVSPTSSEQSNLASSTNISDYLIKTLPGWHVGDLLLDTPPPAFTPVDVFSKMGIGDDLLPLDGERSGPAWWVPQVPQVKALSHVFGLNNGGGDLRFGVEQHAMQGQRWGSGEDVFAVPQIMSSTSYQYQYVPSSNKRSRGLFYNT